MQQDLEEIHRKIPLLDTEIISLRRKTITARIKSKEAKQALQESAALTQEKQAIWNRLVKKQDILHKGRPSLWYRIFFWRALKHWQAACDDLSRQLSVTAEIYQTAKQACQEQRRSSVNLATEHVALKHALVAKQTECEALQSAYHDKITRHEGVCITEEFFARTHDNQQMAAPWLDKKIAHLRQNLFMAAMDVHKDFLLAAARPLRHNLLMLMKSFGMNSLGSQALDALIPDLWKTLFLVVPVISTTFASFARMFKQIGVEELGWLLIDEAGQALPQAAIGALMRNKRAIVVGDPLQI